MHIYWVPVDQTFLSVDIVDVLPADDPVPGQRNDTDEDQRGQEVESGPEHPLIARL